MNTAVDRDALTTYLNDHLAGSVAALDLMDHLAEGEQEPGFEAWLAELRADVKQEQRTLQELVDSIGSENPVAQAMAWMGEKMARIKVGRSAADPASLRRFEALEALALGFCGRRMLWRTLAHLAEHSPLRSGLSFDELAARVEPHIAALEKLRLQAALDALTRPDDAETDEVARG